MAQTYEELHEGVYTDPELVRRFIRNSPVWQQILKEAMEEMWQPRTPTQKLMVAVMR